MNIHRIFLFIAFVFFIQSWPELASAQTRCVNNGNYTQNSAYAVNLNATFSLLFRDVTDTGFANASVGDGADRAYAVVLCRGDRQFEECRSCIQESRDVLLQTCPNQKQAVRWDVRCMLRYSNATIYGVMTTRPMHFWWNNGNATSPEQFEEAASDLLTRLRNEAADGDSLRKVAGRNVSAPDFTTIFALVQCTPDLSKDDCTSCLVTASANIQAACKGKLGCRVLTPSCNLRFAIYPFVNETRLQELQAVPPSPPPSLPLSPPPPPSSSSGKGNGNTTPTVIMIVVLIVVGLLLAVSALIWLKKRKTEKPTEVYYEDDDEIITAESLQYPFSTIKVATNDFSDDNKLGQGGFGAVYKCTPDLSKEDCTSCLFTANGYIQVADCEGRQGCRVMTPSCNLRFEIHPFFDESRLQELDAGSPSPPPSLSPPPSSSSGKGDGNTTRTVIIIVVPIVLGMILAVSAFIWLRKRKTQKPTKLHYEDVDDIIAAESLQFTFITIKVATKDFSDDNKLGQGGFGPVYKGKLPNGQEIAVKRLSMNSRQGDLEFKNEVLLLAKLQHRNLVRLLGFAIEGMEKLLIYELVQNASLDKFIFDETSQSYLDWDRRYEIIRGIARGILYLHEDSRLRIIHRDLKASNILLDGEMIPKIADFGMARLFGQDETHGNTNRIVGTYGYMPPEYALRGQFSIKSDVFSFGVLVLEIISGLKNTDCQSGDNVRNLLSFAWKNWRQGTTVNVVDPSLRSGSGSISEMLRCIHIGLLCVQKDAAERPTMASVVIMLSSSSMRLALPSEPAFYFSSSSAPDLSQIEDLDSREPRVAVEQSKNDVSITKLNPR